ncbi:MAG: hypothetical protein P3A28_08645 [Gemmatimonadota bacterium]|nr:hypothetical protein [Gemmatimonadota bacterium]
MDAIQVAMLALTAVAVGIMCAITVQLYLTVREMRAELHAVRAQILPMLDRLNGSTQIAAAVAVAIAAGVKAFRESNRDAAGDSIRQEEMP